MREIMKSIHMNSMMIKSYYAVGHRDRYIGSLFRAGELVNMIPSS